MRAPYRFNHPIKMSWNRHMSIIQGIRPLYSHWRLNSGAGSAGRGCHAPGDNIYSARFLQRRSAVLFGVIALEPGVSES